MCRVQKRNFEEDFDVVITDLDLPDSNGIELTGWIRERGSDAEVIVITGHASMDTVSDALRLGAFDYLTKPFDDLTLVVRCVERALEKQRLARALSEKVVKLQTKSVRENASKTTSLSRFKLPRMLSLQRVSSLQI